MCGYGEPLLHKDYYYFAKKLSKIGQVEIITNGDTIDDEQLKQIYSSNVSRLIISLYDGPEQLKKYKEMIKRNKIPRDFVILRDRWYNEEKDFGVKLTNRAGTVSVGKQDKVVINKKCYYTSYHTMIDWNGDVFLCPQDWQRRVSMGNIMQKSFLDIWTGSLLTKFRKKTFKWR